jgi:mono/diheme cytochrome c family protein
VSTLRVLDPVDANNELTADIELTNIQRVQAWSQEDAAVITEDGLWRLEQLARVQLAPPTGFSGAAAFCGDPGTNGSLLYGGKLFERRDDGQWWGWDPGASGAAAPSEVLKHQGECLGRDDVQWMTSPDGTLWRVEPTTFFRPIKFEALKAAAVTTGPALGRDVLLGVLDADQLWVGPEDWQRWEFGNGTPESLAAAGGALWTMSGSQLLRFDGVTWTEVEPPSKQTGAVTGLFAHDGGVWVARGGSACHVASSPLVRVEGLRPFSRSKELDHLFSIVSSEDGASLSATLDGEALSLTVDPETGATKGKARLDLVGWHELVVDAGSTSRSLLVKRLPEQERSWAADIKPIFDKHCADCHTSGNAPGGPPLATYQAWTGAAKQIQARVVGANNMPPAANRGPDWSDAQVEIIAQWLAGGMAP